MVALPGPYTCRGVLCGTAKIRAGVFTSGTGSTLENRDDIGKILRDKLLCYKANHFI